MDNFKLVMVGDVGAGKSSMLLTLFQNGFPTGEVPRIVGPGNYSLNYNNINATIRLWEAAGEAEYSQLRPICYPDTEVFVLSFSCSDVASFDKIHSQWQPEIRQHMPNTPIILVATKIDLRTDERVIEDLNQHFGRGPVTNEEGTEMANLIGAVAYLETSSIQNNGVREVFETAHEILLRQGPNRAGQQLSKCSLL